MLIPNKFNGYTPDGSRTLYKGGSSNSAAKMEAERQARITAAVNAINNIFNPTREVTSYNRATSWDPTQTYYDQGGNVAWTPNSNTYEGMAKMNVNDMNPVLTSLNAGNLYTRNTSYEPTNERQKLYDEQKQVVTDLNMQEAARQQKEAERANRFGLSRAGLLGGSVDVDSNADIQRRANEAQLKAIALGDAAAADLQTQDERNKQSLISLAQSGVDTGTAAASAANALDSVYQNALGNRAGATLDNAFSDMGQAYLAQKINQAVQNGFAPASAYQNDPYSINSTRNTYSGNT